MRTKAQYVVIWQATSTTVSDIEAIQYADKETAAKAIEDQDKNLRIPAAVIRGELVTFATRTVIEDAPKKPRKPKTEPTDVPKKRMTKAEKATLAGGKNGASEGQVS